MSFLKKNNNVQPELTPFRSEAKISNFRLDFGLWFLKNRKHFVMGWIALLSVIILVTLGYSLYQFSYYQFVGKKEYEQMLHDLTSSANMTVLHRDSSTFLSFSEARVLLGQNNTADFVATVTNNDTRTVLYFSYYFDVDGQSVGANNDFVFPGETKYIMALQQSMPTGQIGANFIITNARFQRIDRRRIPDWEAYKKERLDFQIDNAKFLQGQESGLSEKINVGQVSFKITNNGAYGYKNLPLTVILKSNENIVSVNRYMLNNFKSGEARSVSLSWPGATSIINHIEIVPVVDLLDDSVYLPYSQ